MKVKNIAANQTEITTANGNTVFMSYETYVACHIPGEGFFRTVKSWSPTTSRHINNFMNRHGATFEKIKTETQEWFDKLV